MAFKFLRIPEFTDITEHSAHHIMPEEDAVRLRKIPRILTVQKDRAAFQIPSVRRMVEIIKVVTPLHHRIVDLGIRKVDPADKFVQPRRKLRRFIAQLRHFPCRKIRKLCGCRLCHDRL